MLDLRWSFLLEVKNRSGERKGFGIHLNDGYIVTLHHVLAAAADQQIAEPAVPVANQGGFAGCGLYPYGTSTPLPEFAVIDAVPAEQLNLVSFRGDVALLRLIESSEFDLHRAPIIHRQIQNNESFNCLGPLKHHETERDEVVSGTFVLPNGLKWQSGANPIIPGFSGAPVYDGSMDRVLGLMQWVRNLEGDPVESDPKDPTVRTQFFS
jgi:hypothetical protein